MKFVFSLVLAGCALAVIGNVFAQEQVPAPAFYWDFNHSISGHKVPSSGTHGMELSLYDGNGESADMLGGAGSGVSGGKPDRALNLTSATGMGVENTGGGAKGENMVERLGGVGVAASATFAGWYKAETPLGGQASLFGQSNEDLDGFRIAASSPTTDTWVLDIVGEESRSGFKAPANAYNEVGEWVFFAVTFDNSSGGGGTVTFYKGTKDSKVQLVKGLQKPLGNFKIGTKPFTLGNFSGGVVNRPFQGWLDNMGVWLSEKDGGGALSLSQLEALRKAGIAGEEIKATPAKR